MEQHGMGEEDLGAHSERIRSGASGGRAKRALHGTGSKGQGPRPGTGPRASHCVPRAESGKTQRTGDGRVVGGVPCWMTWTCGWQSSPSIVPGGPYPCKSTSIFVIISTWTSSELFVPHGARRNVHSIRRRARYCLLAPAASVLKERRLVWPPVLALAGGPAPDPGRDLALCGS